MELRNLFGEAITEFACTTPAQTSSFYKYAFLNWFGCALAGANHEQSTCMVNVYHADTVSTLKPPIGRTESLSASACAAVDCISSAVLAYDDIHFPTSTHPAGPVAAAIMATARTTPISGIEALHALQIGMEVECRIAETIFFSGTGATKGWYTTGITGGIGAAAAVGHILHFTPETMKSALGLAAARAAGTRGMHTAMSFCYAPAVAAESGYLAARLAEKGFTCQIKSLTGNNGLISLLAPNPNFAIGLDGLGIQYTCEKTACKSYPFGFVASAVIKCCLDFSTGNQLKTNLIDSIYVFVSPTSAKLGGSEWPENIYDSVVCLRYITAGVLLDPDFAFTPISGEFSVTSQIAELMQFITVNEDPSLLDHQAKIVINYTDGTFSEVYCGNAPGSEFNPPSEDEIKEKFIRNATQVYSMDKANSLLQALMQIETIQDITKLLD